VFVNESVERLSAEREGQAMMLALLETRSSRTTLHFARISVGERDKQIICRRRTR
jgi:hypothetical protein